MGFQIGDKVIHSVHGLGEIVAIEEQSIHDLPTTCYTFKTNNLTIWVPYIDPQMHSLRLPVNPEHFNDLYEILAGPGNTLPEDRVLRKEHLMLLLRDGKLDTICQVVRDLTHYQRRKKLNDQEKFILERATNSLLVEWAYSLGVSPNQANQAMTNLMGK
jgi:RNA polymerase-interacting CarD/CdnL/TRCF family regulator